MEQEGFGANYISQRMNDWVRSKGYPIVKVSRTPTGFLLTQEPISANHNSSDTDW